MNENTSNYTLRRAFSQGGENAFPNPGAVAENQSESRDGRVVSLLALSLLHGRVTRAEKQRKRWDNNPWAMPTRCVLSTERNVDGKYKEKH
jgi:hypothetical protein